MTTYYTLIFIAFIILCSNSSLAFRIIPYPNEQYQEGFPIRQMIMVLPNEGDITWSQYVASPLYEMLDQRVRRGWGSGRRRRRFFSNDN